MTYGLLERGDHVVVLDDLSTGVRSLVSADADFVEGNVGNVALVREILRSRNVDAVIHFAGSIVVPESVSDPLKYYANNTSATRNLLEACVAEKVGKFVFSSTAAVYGMPEVPMVDENSPKDPINPYGRSKLMIEWMLEDAARAHEFRYVALRYFNVSGGRCPRAAPASPRQMRPTLSNALVRLRWGVFRISTSSVPISALPMALACVTIFTSPILSPPIYWPSMPCIVGHRRTFLIAATVAA